MFFIRFLQNKSDYFFYDLDNARKKTSIREHECYAINKMYQPCVKNLFDVLKSEFKIYFVDDSIKLNHVAKFTQDYIDTCTQFL